MIPLAIEYRSPAALQPHERVARTHSKKQIKQIAKSIERYGFVTPVLVTRDGKIIAGHARVAAALLLAMKEVPTVSIDHLSDAERRAYILADNQLALNAGWDKRLLALELQDLSVAGFDLEDTGFSLAEIDLVIEAAKEADPSAGEDATEDEVPPPADHAVTRRGDIWQLGRHRLICGDARCPEDYAALLEGETVDLLFTDPPYGCKINGHVSGLGKVKHREFAMASGEMSDDQFTEFLVSSLSPAAACCKDGAIAYVFMDWRGAGALIAAGRSAFTEQKQLCVWNKRSGGMGTFYRSKMELVFVYKVGTAPHTNTFGLGDTGRYRTNVWDYAGINSMSATRAEELALHPTVKPVALIADALLDCTRRGEIVLDPFGGSGSTLIAAEKSGRVARLIEYDEIYCDTIIRRYEKYTGKVAVLSGTQETFEDVTVARATSVKKAAA
jgi:DNA modification methylase